MCPDWQHSDDVNALITDPMDTCAVDGCWDYTPDDKVQIYGKTCDDLSNAAAGKVAIYVRCEAILKSLQSADALHARFGFFTKKRACGCSNRV